MKVNYEAKDRKRMVKAIGEALEEKPVYQGVPSCAYQIAEFTVTRDGDLEFPDDTDPEIINGLLDALEEAGFAFPEDAQASEEFTDSVETEAYTDDTDSVDRAWDFVSGWVAGNKGRFTTEVFKPLETYGIIEKNRVCVICRVLNQALEEAGYSYRKCSKGFAERGYIITDTEEKAKNRTQEVKRINGISTRVYVLNMTVKNEEEEDDDFLT